MEYSKIKAIIMEVMKVEENEITLDTSFVNDLGADSLDIFQIITGLEDEFNVEISNDEIQLIETVGDAVDRIKHATY